MCQRQCSKCKCLESSSPFIFVSVIIPPNSILLSPTHPGFTDPVWLHFSPYVPKPYSLIFVYIKKSLCHPAHLHAYTLYQALLQVLVIQQWPWVLRKLSAGKAVGWQSYWQLTREVSRWEHEERWSLKSLQVGDHLYGLPEAALRLGCGRSQSWCWKDSMRLGEVGRAWLWLGLNFILQTAPFCPFLSQCVLPLPLP